jgi:hypothetical protein
VRQHYAQGASVLGLMQDFVFEETGLAARVQAFAPTHPKLVHFPGRDYKRVYEDVEMLTASGLLSREDGSITAPFDAISAELRV